MKQIGLATLNFESSNGWMPPDVDYLVPPYLPDPDPSAVATSNQENAGNFTRILPFMDQQNLYNLINFNLAALDQLNVPPAYGGSGGLFPGIGQNSAYSVTINMFLCPSSPAPSSINYYNTCWSGYGNGSGNPVPNPPNQIWGRTDYFATPGFHASLLTKLGFPAAYVAGDHEHGQRRDLRHLDRQPGDGTGQHPDRARSDRQHHGRHVEHGDDRRGCRPAGGLQPCAQHLHSERRPGRRRDQSGRAAAAAPGPIRSRTHTWTVLPPTASAATASA